MTSTRSALTLLTAAVLALAACGSDSTTSSTTPTPASSGGGGSTPATTAADGGGGTDTAATLTISGRAFGSVTATAGMPITIVNEDGFGHTVTDRDGEFDVKVAGNATGTLTIDEPGTYEIVCTIHPDMAGEITVD
jgi:plastocyanin